MRLAGRTVSRTTARDVEEAKRRLYNDYFRLSNVTKLTTKKPRRK